MKNTIKRINLNIIEWFLPWIATAVTALPYLDYRSRLLDRLLVISVGK